MASSSTTSKGLTTITITAFQPPVLNPLRRCESVSTIENVLGGIGFIFDLGLSQRASQHHPTMSADPSISLADSALTIPSDSENYSSGNNDHDHESSTAPDDASSSPMILYTPPSIWGLLRGAAINLVLPFVNGLMLGFGELFAHEAAFRLGWSGTKVCFGTLGLRIFYIQLIALDFPHASLKIHWARSLHQRGSFRTQATSRSQS